MQSWLIWIARAPCMSMLMYSIFPKSTLTLLFFRSAPAQNERPRSGNSNDAGRNQRVCLGLPRTLDASFNSASGMDLEGLSALLLTVPQSGMNNSNTFANSLAPYATLENTQITQLTASRAPDQRVQRLHCSEQPDQRIASRAPDQRVQQRRSFLFIQINWPWPWRIKT